MNITKIAAFHLPEHISPAEYDEFMSKVAPQRRDRISKFKFVEDAYRSLFGEALVRAVLCKDYGYTNADIHFEHNEYGKPRVAGDSDFSFNISHSGCWVMMIWGQGVLGIDVEQIKPIDLSIARRFFSMEETDALMQKDDGEKMDYFYTLWTLKESYIKAAGKGLSIPLDSFSIVDNGAGTFELKPDKASVRFHTFELEHGYKAAACTEGHEQNERSPSISYVTLDDLQQWIR